MLPSIMLTFMGFGASWVYVGAMKQAYKKVLVGQLDNKDSQLDLQAKLETLSRNEREVLNLILQHKSNQQISDELFFSSSTLKSYIDYRK
ncbi:LuxR C-terminal-related transcriptional regulator [Mongoliitalea daihaiensis]|uniref:LuxR C-terminal-related transcriptional regulator n=1 Tax=Mongoliitalea daihaiensis TaxID=2782006 RepID=UPI001F245330|nr:LuxR C-terminal-related transcriptional regulator [Mongoliitalea daihaiensis]UJP63828.1 hypothetical protein IPZ59_13440 [Mongoliitalea daihaiensis]